MSFSSLPDEITEIILARTPKWAYPNLSLVCKKFHSLLSSPQLYTTRSNLGTTETCLYFWLNSPNHSSSQWFTLLMKPDEISTSDDGDILNGYSLIPLPSFSHSSLVPYESTVAVGSDIYVMGGLIEPSSSARILDCRSHTWRDAPNMNIARANAGAIYLNEKIYVTLGRVLGSDELAVCQDVFDIKTQTWKDSTILDSDGEVGKYIDVNCNAFEGKFYVGADNTNTYEIYIDWCMIENVRYCCTRSRYLMWYNSERKEWRVIKGLRELREHPTRGLKINPLSVISMGIVNCDGKLVVMWKQLLEQDNGERKTKIWFAKIVLEKRHRDEIWGKTEWVNCVLTVPDSYECSSCLAVLI